MELVLHSGYRRDGPCLGELGPVDAADAQVDQVEPVEAEAAQVLLNRAAQLAGALERRAAAGGAPLSK